MFASDFLLDVFKELWIYVLQQCFRHTLVSDYPNFNRVFGHVQNQRAEGREDFRNDLKSSAGDKKYIGALYNHGQLQSQMAASTAASRAASSAASSAALNMTIQRNLVSSSILDFSLLLTEEYDHLRKG